MGGSDRPKKIGLLGPYGFGNLGDAAIQQAMVQHIKQHIPDGQIYGFSLNPEDTFNRHGIQSFLINRRPPGPNNLLHRIPRQIRYKIWMRILLWFFYRVLYLGVLPKY